MVRPHYREMRKNRQNRLRLMSDSAKKRQQQKNKHNFTSLSTVMRYSFCSEKTPILKQTDITQLQKVQL